MTSPITLIIRKIFDDYDEKNGAQQKIDYTERAQRIVDTWTEGMSSHRLTTGLICELHRLVCDDLYIPINDPQGGISGFAKVGEYRTIPMSAPSYLKKGAVRLFVPPHEIAPRMEQLVVTMSNVLAAKSSKEAMIENILAFSVELSTVHPFPNQNWRVILSLMELLAFQAGLEPFCISYINKVNPALLIRSVEETILYQNVQPMLFVLDLYQYSFTPNGMRYNSKVIEFGRKYFAIDYKYFEVNESSIYSSIKPQHITSVESIFKSENIQPKIIIDATANVGGDTINFIRMFPLADIYAIEIDTQTADILSRNIENIQNILGFKPHGKYSVINKSAVKYFDNDKSADMVYFDPPWGGAIYQLADSLDLYLDSIHIGLFIGDILSKKLTHLVVLKLPINANLNGILQNISSKIDINTTLHDITHTVCKTVDYRLLFIRPQSNTKGEN